MEFLCGELLFFAPVCTRACACAKASEPLIGAWLGDLLGHQFCAIGAPPPVIVCKGVAMSVERSEEMEKNGVGDVQLHKRLAVHSDVFSEIRSHGAERRVSPPERISFV